MSVFFWNLISFIIALAILVTVHEFGHFWVARRVGVHVERFSVGFGKVLWRRVDKRGCEFAIAMIPLGGYVKMLDERVKPVAPELRQFAFNNKTIAQRAAVIAAGPLANFLLALVLLWMVMLHGVQTVKPVIGSVLPDSIAAQAQLTPEMELLAVDGVETPDWNAVAMELLGKIGADQVQLTVRPFANAGADSRNSKNSGNSGNSFTNNENNFTDNDKNKPLAAQQNNQLKTLDLRYWQFDSDKQSPISSLGIVPVMPKVSLTLSRVLSGSAASKAGLQAGDKLVRVNGQLLTQWSDFTHQVQENPGKTLALEIIRDSKPLSLQLVPAAKTVNGNGAIQGGAIQGGSAQGGSAQGEVQEKVQGFAGVEPALIPLADEYRVSYQYGPLSAVPEAAAQTWRMMKLTVNMLGKLITGDVKLSHLSGPISIAEGAGASAAYGLIPYLMFLALISINLGVINLFPLPVLDGGHLLFLLLEKLKGAPVSERFLEMSYRTGVVVLMLLMGIAIFNDFSRL